MNLLTYAVSQKLSHDNEMWRYIHNNEPIPQDVVSAAFEETLKNTSDVEAERLVSDYDAYIANHIPVTFVPQGDGVRVSGEIQDAALDVIQTLHGRTPEDVIQQTVESSIRTINPGREIEVHDIQRLADDINERARKSHARLNAFVSPVEEHRDVAGEFKPFDSVNAQHKQDVVDLVDEEPAMVVASPERQTALGNARLALEEAERNLANGIVEDIPVLEEPSDIPELDELPPLDNEPTFMDSINGDDVIPDIQDVEEDSEKKREEVTEAGVLASVWNSFVSDIKGAGLESRLELHTPLTMAVV